MTESKRIIRDLGPEEAHQLIQKMRDNPNFVIIDVRTPDEYASAHLQSAINLDYHATSFEDELGRLDREGIYLLYCLVGIRLRNAQKIMGDLGFAEVYNMTGGIRQWYLEKRPVVWPSQQRYMQK